jgi:hypothetical protein
MKKREGCVYTDLGRGAIAIVGGISGMEMTSEEKCVSSQSISYLQMSLHSRGKGGEDGTFTERMNSGRGKSSKWVMVNRSASARRRYVGVG